MTTAFEKGPTRPSAGFGVLLASAGLTAVFVYAVFIGGTHPGITETGVRMMSGLLAILVLATWAIVALVKPSWRPQNDLLLPIVIVFLVFLVSSLGSQRPRLSQDAILQAGGLALAFLLLRRLAADPFFRPRLIRIVAAVTIVILGAYTMHVLISWGIWWSSLGRLSAPPLRPPPAVLNVVSPWLAVLLGRLDLVAVNLTAGICLMATPFAAAVVARRSRSLGVGVAAVGLFVLFATGSRGALLGAALAAILAGALTITIIRAGFGCASSASPRASRTSIAGIGIAGLSLAVVAVALAPAILQRFTAGIDDARLSLFGSTLTLFAEHPILGTGPGTWSILHSGVTPEGARNIVQNHAHNSYLQTLSDVGIVGAVACLALALIIVRRLFVVFRSCAPADRLMVGAILVGLAGAAGNAMSDHFLNLPNYSLILMALVAIGLSTPARSMNEPSAAASRSSRWAGAAPAALLGVAIVVPMPAIFAHAGAELRAADAREAANRGDWAQAEEMAREAVRADPGLTLYRIELGLAMAHLGRPAARSVIEQAAAEDTLPHLQLSAAWLASADGDRAAALDAALMARSRSTGEAMIELNVGEIARQAGRDDLAVEAWGTAMRLNVELAGSAFFSAPERTDLRMPSIARAESLLAEAGDEATSALLLAYSGSPAEAEAALRATEASPTRDVALARVLWLAGEQLEAVNVLERVAAADPMATSPTLYLVRYCELLDDQPCLDRYLPRAMMFAVGGEAGTSNEGSVIPAPIEQRWRGVPRSYPKSVYLQGGYDDLLAPGVLVVGVP